MTDDAPILNPRRAPRMAIRCLVHGEAGGAPFWSETEDLGPLGCQLILPSRLARGAPVRLQLSWPSLPETLRVEGLVAWATREEPWRHGVAFGPGSLDAAARWVWRLTALHPELAAGPGLPGRLEAGARLFLGAPPRHLIDFTTAELVVLRQVQAGVTVGELRGRLAASWEEALRALYSLLARHAVVLAPEGAAPAHAWNGPLDAAGPLRPAAVARLKLRPAGRPEAD